MRLRALKRVCCRVSSRPIVAIWGKQGACHKAKSGKRKSGKRSWKLLYLEISFSWFKVVFLMKR
ncbi:hypothetical protein BB431_00210 [Helicobacter pylori]|nr:hypothetical protein BB431_00210 [Helicobacter pylori]